MKKQIYIFDIDGVLIDSSHRYRNLPDGRIDLAYWVKNQTPEKIAQDKLLPLVKFYQACLADDSVYTVICTSRVFSDADYKFIAERLGNPDKLFNRPAGNTRHDAELKKAQLSKFFNLKQFKKLPKIFLDDNKKNLQAVAKLGILTLHIPSRITENA